VQLLNQTPAKVLNKAYLKQNVQQHDIQGFHQNIDRLFERLNPSESEENQKNLVCDFLKDTYYKDRFEINTAGREDLAIHRGKHNRDAVGVIIENKRIDSPEMMTFDRPNVKALHELVLYYFVERELKKNIEVSHLIATDLYNWYVFDENDFRKIFYENSAFKKIYQTKTQQNKD
jgi:adenine-specific DNA-methyltransferase